MLEDFTEKHFQKFLKEQSPTKDSLFLLHFETKEVPCAIVIADVLRKQLPEATIGAFGLHSTMYPQQVVEDRAFDFAVIGDIEPIAVDLVKGVQQKKPLGNTPNLALPTSKARAANIKPPASLQVNMDVLPLYDFTLLPLDKYVTRDTGFLTGNYDKKSVFRFAASRGCKHKCNFCTYPFKGYVRMQNANVIRHLDHIVEACDPDTIFFDDPEFFLNKREAMELAGILKERYRFDCMTTSRAHYYHESFISKDFMRRMRGKWLIWDMGAESANPQTLKDIGKGINIDQLRQAADYAGEVNARAGFSFMVGIPGESEEQMVQNVKFMEELKRRTNGNIQITYQYYQPIGPTKMRDQAEALGFRSPQRLRDWMSVFDPETGSTKITLHPWVKRPEMLEYLMLVVKYAINESYGPKERETANAIRSSWSKRKASNNWSDLAEVRECRKHGLGYFGSYSLGS
jgi:radical SAM superfamily enzyme YgiQ (UPF0313 family)